jgi:distribution and morphology protein 12
MSLPLKLSITGLQLAADLIVAFDGEKKRIHLTIIDDDYESNAHAHGHGHGHPHGGHGVLQVGQRLLPEMRIDSEIGHSDAHVLRNVGKVERFIADVVRKTLVDELVFPNFHTIAL